MKLKWIFKIAVRICFLFVWYLIGYIFSNAHPVGFLSAICAFVLMEICYFIDRKTSGIDQALSRLDFLDETLTEADKTCSLILQQLMIKSDSITNDSDFSEGVKEGIKIAKTVVEDRFSQVSEQLKEKKSLL